VTSIAWSGPSLILTSVSGAVSFLLPYPPSYTPPSSSSSSSAVRESACAMVRSLGFRPERTGVHGTDNRSLSMGLLCSLPRHMTASGELLISYHFLSPDSPVPHTPLCILSIPLPPLLHCRELEIDCVFPRPASTRLHCSTETENNTPLRHNLG
jgi:hypothetical protein